MLPRSRHAISTTAAVTFLAIAAAFACLWRATAAAREVVPIAFIVVVVLVAIRYGATAGILGSFVGAAIFAGWLYAPTGSFRIHEAAARDRLGWMLLAGISLSYLLAAPALSDRDHKN